MKQSLFNIGFETAAKSNSLINLNITGELLTGYSYFWFFEKSEGRNRNKAESKDHHKKRDSEKINLFK
jgi:hypothetical protein